MKTGKTIEMQSAGALKRFKKIDNITGVMPTTFSPVIIGSLAEIFSYSILIPVP